MKELLRRNMENSTMTAFEWRVKLLTEHRLYLSPQRYCGFNYDVYEVYSYDTSAINYKSNMIIRRKIHFNKDRLCCYCPKKLFTDGTVQEVLDKIIKTAQLEQKRQRKEIEAALNKL